MAATNKTGTSQAKAEAEVDRFASQLGPFVVAADTTRMPMIFTNAKSVLEEIIYVNNSFVELTNFQSEEIISRPFAELLSLRAKTHGHSLAKISHMPSVIIRCVKKGGAEFNASVFVSPVQDANGSLEQYFVSLVDLSDAETSADNLKSVEARLIQVSRLSAMGTMAATLAHELNQPLEAISNYAAGCVNILEASGFQSGKLQDGLRAIGAASERAGNIIRRLRDMTRNQAPRSERFPLSEALVEATELVRAGGCDGITIESQIYSTAWVTADRIEIEQVIVNLIKNACEALGEGGFGGVVTGSISSENGEVRLSVQDSGLGIHTDDLDRIFDWADSSKPDGMGIGLAISRTIIERHRGRIALDETGKSGSRFSFWLPEAAGP